MPTISTWIHADSRGIALASFFGPTASLGKGSFYLGSYVDAGGQPLRGENSYRLRVSANAPVNELWALTVYDSETAALFRESTRLTVGSLDNGLRKNADGSVDIYIGPKVPAGQESNWLYTPPGKGWWPWFRFYGPQQALFDKTGSCRTLKGETEGTAMGFCEFGGGLFSGTRVLPDSFRSL